VKFLNDNSDYAKILRYAEYLQQTGQSDAPARFDVAEVTPLDSGRWMVHIIKGAFTA
jgi:putative endonuclease